MATPFKLKSGNASAFKNLGASPVKQDLPKNWNKGVTPGYETTKAAKTQNFRDAANKIKTVSSKTNIGSKVIKAGKFLGGKALGIVGMLMSTSSKADQPTYESTGDAKYKKGESQQIKDLLTKHKLKGGNN